ncbi:CTP synthetase [Rhodosalinus sp.]|uniref:CTP synthetase n=1 Tax=Rhodosalinus sp. TaxID=2047741 RepID=UPI00397C3C81
MFKLALVLHIFIGATLAGSAVIAVLVAGYGTLWPIVIAALVGFVGGFPVSWIIARQLYEEG